MLGFSPPTMVRWYLVRGEEVAIYTFILLVYDESLCKRGLLGYILLEVYTTSIFDLTV